MADARVERLYREHGHVVRRRARQLLGNAADADEAMQEVFMSLVQKPEQLDGVRSEIAFLYAATTHRCLNRLRDHHNRQRLVDLHVRPATSNVSDGSGGERLAQVRQVLAR